MHSLCPSRRESIRSVHNPTLEISVTAALQNLRYLPCDNLARFFVLQVVHQFGHQVVGHVGVAEGNSQFVDSHYHLDGLKWENTQIQWGSKLQTILVQSGGLNTKHWSTKCIVILKILKFGFQIAWFWTGRSLQWLWSRPFQNQTIRNPNKMARHFVWISKGFEQNGRHFVQTIYSWKTEQWATIGF